MRSFLVFASLLSTLAFADQVDPVSAYMTNTLTQGQQILDDKDTSTQTTALCQWLGTNLDNDSIATTWLSTYANLTRDNQAIAQFHTMVPSIFLSKILQAVGTNNVLGTFAVDPTSTASGSDFMVGVTITSARGQAYKGTAVVDQVNSAYRVLDAQYMGFSAVDYLGQDFKNQLDKAYNADPNNSLPVTALINYIQGQTGYVACP